MAKWPISKASKDKGLGAEDGAVLALIADPAQIDEFLVIKGLMGQGVLQDTWRIYQNYEFTEYYEVKSADIKRVEPPVGRTVRVWLDRKVYRHVIREEFSAEAQYLEGRDRGEERRSPGAVRGRQRVRPRTDPLPQVRVRDLLAVGA